MGGAAVRRQGVVGSPIAGPGFVYPGGEGVEITGWWFGCHFWNFPINIGNFIIPIDELIFFRGVAQPPTSITITLFVCELSMICPYLYPRPSQTNVSCSKCCDRMFLDDVVLRSTGMIW